MVSWRMEQFLRDITHVLTHGNLSFKKVLMGIEEKYPFFSKKYEYGHKMRLMFSVFGSSIGYHDGIWNYWERKEYDGEEWEYVILQFHLQCNELHLQQNYYRLYKGLKKVIQTMHDEQIMIESMASFAKRINLK